MSLHRSIQTFRDLGMIVEEFCIRKHNKFLTGLFNDLVDETPVDTGAARSNWLLTPGRPGTRKNPTDGTIYQKPATPDVAAYTYRWRKWYLTNLTDYISELNDGSSKQAPSGWIDSAVQRNIIKFQSGFTRTD